MSVQALAACATVNSTRIIDNPAVADFDDAFGLGGHIAVMRNENHRMAGPRQLFEQGHDLGAALAVQRPGRFVGQNNVPAIHERAGNGHALLLPTRKLVGMVGQAVGQAQTGKQRFGPYLARLRGLAGIHGGDFDVAQGIQRADQVIALKHEPERLTAQPSQFVGREHGDVLAGEPILPGCGPIQAAQDVHERGLARARGAHEGHKLAGGNGQRNAAQHFHGRAAVLSAIGFADIAQFDQRRVAGCRHHWNLPAATRSRRMPVTSLSPGCNPESTSACNRSCTPVRTSRVLIPPSGV
jgi:hypothetical protein